MCVAARNIGAKGIMHAQISKPHISLFVHSFIVACRPVRSNLCSERRDRVFTTKSMASCGGYPRRRIRYFRQPHSWHAAPAAISSSSNRSVMSSLLRGGAVIAMDCSNELWTPSSSNGKFVHKYTPMHAPVPVRRWLEKEQAPF